MVQPRRLRQGSPGREHGPRRTSIRRLAARQDAARRHVRQHRHRLRHDRRGAGFPREAVRPIQRHGRAQAAAPRVRRRADLHRSHGRIRRRDSRSAETGCRQRRFVFLSRSVQQRRKLARALRDDRARRFSRRPKAGSRTSSPASAPAARSWARDAGSARRIRRSS